MEDFLERCAPYLADLQNHCRKLTASSWDTEDLLQETMLKVYLSLQQKPNRQLSKAYFRKVATSIRIDQTRKKQIDTQPLAEELDAPSPSAPLLTVRESFEHLAEHVTARQMVLVLLVDVFRFTAREAADLLKSTEGAVKEALKRARQRLQTATAELGVPTKKAPAEMSTPALFEAFLQAFRVGDPQAICDSYQGLLARGVAVVGIQRSAGRLLFSLRDPDGHLISLVSDISSDPVSF